MSVNIKCFNTKTICTQPPQMIEELLSCPDGPNINPQSKLHIGRGYVYLLSIDLFIFSHMEIITTILVPLGSIYWAHIKYYTLC